MKNSLATYAALIAPARAALEVHPGVAPLLDPNTPRDVLERFLLEYCSLAVQLTAPVEGWIRRAGERCVALGRSEVGQALIAHSKHEAGHDAMLVEDTRKLVARYNVRHGARIQADALLARPPTLAMSAYQALHERTISSGTPEGQVAIELEIEQLSLSVGAPFLAACAAKLGPEQIADLSFLREHVALDVGHTAMNIRMMERLLRVEPERAKHLAAIGAAAIETYAAFLHDCLTFAQRDSFR